MVRGRLPTFRQEDVGDEVCILEERGNLFVAESCDAAAYAGDEECELGMLLRKEDKVVHVGLDGIDAALHGGDGVALTLEPYALSVYGAETFVGNAGSTTAVVTGKVAAKDEDLVFFEVCDELRCGHFEN